MISATVEALGKADVRTITGDRKCATGLVISGFLSRYSAVGSKKVEGRLSRGT